jgi:hypothetical protein
MKKKNVLMTAIAIFGLATITIAQVPSYVPTSGLVGWWPFNGNSNDESGNGNNGTVNGAMLTTDRFGNTNDAFSFSSSNNNFISINNNPLQDGSASISGWFYSYSQSDGPFVHIGADDGNISNCNGYFSGLFSFNTLKVDASCNGASNTGWNANINTWYHFTLTRLLNNLSIFINGNLVGTFNYGNINPPSNYIFFGATYFTNSLYFNGKLDDIGIWDRALTQQEITDLYNGCQLSVNTQPTNQTTNVNNNAQFVVSSTDPSATFQWQTDLGVGFQNLNSIGQYSGTTNDTLNVTNVTMSNNNQPFRCIINTVTCSDTSNVAVLTVNNNVGINETTQDKLLSVFPNPAQNIINVNSDSKLIGQVYSIYDNAGRVVLTGKFVSQNTTIEIGNLSGGIYMFRVGENMRQTFKIIKSE